MKLPGNMQAMMKQAQQMQERMQQEVALIRVEASAGGGMVTVTMTCRHDVRRVSVDPSLLKDDKEVMEDLIAAAMNDAVRKAEKTSQEKMSGMAAGLGLNLPGGLGLPF